MVLSIMYTIVTQNQDIFRSYTAGREPRGRASSAPVSNKLVSSLFFQKVSVDQFP